MTWETAATASQFPTLKKRVASRRARARGAHLRCGTSDACASSVSLLQNKKACPTANFKLRFTKKETNSEMKEGQEEVRELAARNYGRDEWWLLCWIRWWSRVRTERFLTVT